MSLLRCRASIFSLLLCFLVLICGCAGSASSPVEVAQKSLIKFADLDRFDQDLERNLKQQITPITIEFYGQVSINDLPERLQNWLSLIDNHGKGIEIIDSSDNVQKGGLGFMLSMLPQARAFFLHNRRIELIQPYSASIELQPRSDVISQLVVLLPPDPDR